MRTSGDHWHCLACDVKWWGSPECWCCGDTSPEKAPAGVHLVGAAHARF